MDHSLGILSSNPPSPPPKKKAALPEKPNLDIYQSVITWHWGENGIAAPQRTFWNTSLRKAHDIAGILTTLNE
jgi:hypothetical protein